MDRTDVDRLLAAAEALYYARGIHAVGIDEEVRTVVLHRGRLRVACNLGDYAVTIALGASLARILLASEPVEGEAGALSLPPESFAIVQLT